MKIGGIYKFCGNKGAYAIFNIGLGGWTPLATSILFLYCPTFRYIQIYQLYYHLLVFFVNSLLLLILVIILNACEMNPIFVYMSSSLLPSTFISPPR